MAAKHTSLSSSLLDRIIHKAAAIRCNRVQVGCLRSSYLIHRDFPRNVLEDDSYCAVVRSPRIIEPLDQMLDCEIYHWNHKIMMKEPRVDGAWEWHQDYGPAIACLRQTRVF